MFYVFTFNVNIYGFHMSQSTLLHILAHKTYGKTKAILYKMFEVYIQCQLKVFAQFESLYEILCKSVKNVILYLIFL